MAASAGGLETLRVILGKLPADIGMAFVVIQHLDPNHESMLVDVLGLSTAMQVAQVRDGVTLAPNHVYVIPPNADIALRGGAFIVATRDSLPGHFMPADHFLRSLAEHAAARAVAIVLSGTGSDGALGIEAVRRAGGTTFAQDPKTARHDGMPRAAIATGCVDFVLSPEAIADELVRIARLPPVEEEGPDAADGDVADGAAAAGPVPVAELDLPASSLARIFELLRAATSADFSLYRRTSISRRIERRMALHKLDKLEKYVDLLEHDPAELEALYGELLIKVTAFFRDPEAFTALTSLVFPEIARHSPGIGRDHSPIRIWVPACATGEEAYSVAIELLEYLAEHRLNPGIQIFATDLDDEAIGIARAAVYPESIAEDVSPERLRRFFVKHQAGYQVDKSVRDLCVFARQNVAADPPFSRLDLISCRNLLIYLEPVLQKRVIAAFHYALKPHGFLVLGASESVGASVDLFELRDKGQKVYSRRQNLGVTRAESGHGWLEGRRGAQTLSSLAGGAVAGLELQREADRIVLDGYSPPGVIIDEAFTVVQYRGKTAPWLEVAPGKPSLNLLKMLHGALLPELRNAVQKAKRTGHPVGKISVPTERVHEQDVSFEVIPLHPGHGALHFLILFFDSPGPAEQRQIEQLRQELVTTRQYLQSVIDEQEAANEEMQSANEEILSSNEELQSINEELETAEEELQATNEELATVNEELLNRNSGLRLTNEELTDVFSSVDIAIVTLSGDLRVRRFTPLASRVFNMIPSDIGRPITDFVSRIKGVAPGYDLGQMVREVIDGGAIRQCLVSDGDGRRYSLSVRPSRGEGRSHGAVMVLVDVRSVQGTA